jgi:hypothetical protein
LHLAVVKKFLQHFLSISTLFEGLILPRTHELPMALGGFGRRRKKKSQNFPEIPPTTCKTLQEIPKKKSHKLPIADAW